MKLVDIFKGSKRAKAADSTRPRLQPKPIARLLAIALLFSVSFTATTQSHLTAASAVDESARVAAFDVSVSHEQWYTDDFNAYDRSPLAHEFVDYHFYFQNNSEVALVVYARIQPLSNGAANNTAQVLAEDLSDASDGLYLEAFATGCLIIRAPGTYEGLTSELFFEYQQLD